MSLPQTSVGWFALILVLIAGIVWLAKNIRSNDLNILRATNTDLMAAHDYNQKQIKDLKDEVTILKTEVEALKNINGNMKAVMIEALTEYFTKNPSVAEKFAKNKNLVK